MNKYLTDEQCQEILQNRFQTKEIKLISHELKPLSENLEGYMGEHFNLTLTYERNGKTSKEILFLKRKPTNKSQAQLSDDGKIYEKEILFFDIIIPALETKGYDTSFSPKRYLCIPNEAIVLENLSTQGYKIMPRNEGFDLGKMKLFLRAIALYHGAGFAYERSKSAELGRKYQVTDEYRDILQEEFFCQFLSKNAMSMKFWEGCNKTISSLIKVLPKDEQYKKDFLDLFLNYPTSKVFAEETKFAKTFGHGDLWSNNVMFKFDGNTPKECCLIDFQLFRYFYPAFDVILAINGNTDAEFRAKHLHELYDYYYNSLASVVENYGYNINDIMTIDDFYKTIELVKPECLFQIAFTDTIIFMPKEELTSVFQDEDDSNYQTYIFNNSEIAVKLFKENEQFREKVTNTLYDVYDALVAKKNNISW